MHCSHTYVQLCRCAAIVRPVLRVFCFCHECYYINRDVYVKSVIYKLMLCLRGMDVDLSINILWSTTCADNLTSYKNSQAAAAVLHLRATRLRANPQPSWRHLTCYKIAFKNLHILPKSIIMNLPDQVHVKRNLSGISGLHHRVVATRGAAQIPCVRSPLRLSFVMWRLTLWVLGMEMASCYPSGD